MMNFDTILGQDEAVNWLRRAYAADHLPHGLIFAGPVGVGKATTARALASLFLCAKPKDGAPCGKCESCVIMSGGNHPDFHVITKELIRYHDKTGKSKGIDLSINVLRPELVEPASRMAVMGVGKVFVIEQAELMNPQAQNSILKTLEEPAGRTLIILLTDQPGILLPTIRSRCQMVRFTPLDSAMVLAELQKRGMSKVDATDASRLAAGSLGVALKWLNDGVITYARELIDRLDSLQKTKSADDLPEWFKRAADAYAEKQLERDPLGSKDQMTREGLSLYLRVASDHIRNRLTQTDGADELDQTCSAIEAIARAEEYLDANVNVPLVFQQLAVALETRAMPVA